MTKEILNYHLNKIACSYLLRDESLQELNRAYNDRPDIWNYINLEKAYEEGRANKIARMFLFHNFVKIYIRTFLTNTYGGKKKRSITGTGQFVDELNEIANSYYYDKTIKTCFRNTCLYGHNMVMPFTNDQGEMDFYIFDPLNSVLIVDPNNINKNLLIAEKNSDNVKFHSVWGSGIYDRSGNLNNYVLYDQDLPSTFALVTRGIDETDSNKVYGKSLALLPLKYSILISKAMLNVNFLLHKTCDYIVQINLEDPNSLSEKMNGDSIILKPNEGFEFKKPEFTAEEFLAFIDKNMNFFVAATGIPKSVFMPSSSTDSSESARLDSNSMISQTMDFAKEWQHNEKQLLINVAKFLHFERNGELLNTREISQLYNIEVKITPTFHFENDSVAIDTAIKKYSSGLVKVDDVIKELNPDIDTDSIEVIKQQLRDKALKA